MFATPGKELTTYEQHRERLLRDCGKYVVIYGEVLAGPWERYSDALQKGYEQFGLAPFLIKRIERARHAA